MSELEQTPTASPVAATVPPAPRRRRLRGVVEEAPVDGATDHDLPPAVLPPPAPVQPTAADQQER